MGTGSLWKGLFVLQDFSDLVGILSRLLQSVMNGLLGCGQALQAAIRGYLLYTVYSTGQTSSIDQDRLNIYSGFLSEKWYCIQNETT
ncbi:MAG: hypothetical protein ACRDIV_21900 [Ktedonobacteraceae bacterium]